MFPLLALVVLSFLGLTFSVAKINPGPVGAGPLASAVAHVGQVAGVARLIVPRAAAAARPSAEATPNEAVTVVGTPVPTVPPVGPLAGHAPDEDAGDTPRPVLQAAPVLLPPTPTVRVAVVGEGVEGTGTGPAGEVGAATEAATRTRPPAAVPHDLGGEVGRPLRPPLNVVHRPIAIPATTAPGAAREATPLQLGAAEVVTRDVRPTVASTARRVPTAGLPRSEERGPGRLAGPTVRVALDLTPSETVH